MDHPKCIVSNQQEESIMALRVKRKAHNYFYNRNAHYNDLEQILEARTSLYYHSFLPTAIRGWNSLSEEVKSCDSINAFKHQSKKTKTVPEQYYTGRRKTNILHTRLRTNSSAMNIDHFTRNVAVAGEASRTPNTSFTIVDTIQFNEMSSSMLLQLSQYHP